MIDVVSKAKEVIIPVVERLGYEVVDIEYKKEYGENNLTVYIFKKGGVSLDDCELVNNELDPVLEINDITEGASYNLNISSPGLDRKIVTPDDFRRNMDTDIELVFVKPLGKKKHTHGILVAYDENSVTILQKDREVKYDKGNLSVVRPYIDFK
ncbi:MAG TPA: ribosome maturation factor RimP [Clostridia bacterium]|nr:ribosome maturation factor RimP [Clostridia bacterium]